LLDLGSSLNTRDLLSVKALLHYDGYLDKQQLEVDKFNHLAAMQIPNNIVYGEVLGLSTESRQKLTAARPATLAQALQISGITPAAISCLMIWMKSDEKLKARQHG